jgi:hypothetical protein
MKNHRLFQVVILTVLGVVATVPASASLLFVPTFTANFNTNFGANAAAAQAAWIQAANGYSSVFTDNIHINITVDAVTGTGTLGQSSQSIFSIGYGALYNAVLADVKTQDDVTATGTGGSLGGNGTAGSAVDPIGGPHNWWTTRSQEKALGLIADDGSNDGTITFGTGFSYTFSGAIAGGTIDFQGVASHEISEIMGRIGLCGSSVSGSPAYTLTDAYSFSGAGTRNTGNGAGTNFSINDGSTLLKSYNNAASNGGDCRDWASGTNDSFNAFSSSGVSNPVTAVDLREMDVLGYDAVPEPSTLSLFGAGLALLGFAKLRSRSKRLAQ